MEGASVLSPTSWEKRRAWARQSRCWRTTVLEEEAAMAMQDVPELQPPHLDDVFLEGSSSRKIETWLQDCGGSVEVLPEEPGLPAPFGCSSNGTSFEDDLTLGAEALLLPSNDKATDSKTLLEKPWPGRHLHLGHSMASSAISSGTNKTTSSLSEILEWCQEDAEEILYNLGFAQDEPLATARIPARFFTAPSQAKGINFQLFLKAQVRRLEMEDPCLTLASRFQQVEALAATADAFFCLYSYVSKTPLQKISPTQAFWTCPEIPSTWLVPMKAEAMSPVDRLKKAVSKMCLYISPRAESPRTAGGALRARSSSLGTVVQEVLERARGEWFRFDQTAVEGLEGATCEMPTRTAQGLQRVQRSIQQLSELAGDVAEHLCHGGGAAPPPPGEKGELCAAPALSRLQWAQHELPDGLVRACAEAAGCPGLQEKKDPGEAPMEMVPSRWEVSRDASCPSEGAGPDEHSSQAGSTVALWAHLALSPGTRCMASKAMGTATRGHPLPRSETGFALDLPRTPSQDDASSCAALGVAPTKGGLEACGEQAPSKQDSLPGGSSHTCGPWDAAHPQGQDTKAPGLAGLSVGEVPALWAADGGSGLHRPHWAPVLPLRQDDSFEMEEVQSTSEDESGTSESGAWLPTPVLARERRRFMLQAHSGQSDSSGFVEEPAPDLTPTPQLPDIASSKLCRTMGGPCGTGQAV
ncbi:protein TESPA1 isoform X2 [Carettochelys insculpta]|uniref:protein TESPA1 isoform X2 n=1 Tax=Carettochelys insculpta TaxID=44489 RepID=UPI003EB742B0